MPALPARIVVLIGSALVVFSYALHRDFTPPARLVTGRAEDDTAAAPMHI